MMKATSPATPPPPVAAMPQGGTNGLRDIKAPVDIPSGWAWVWWVLAALALAALLFWAWRCWQKRRAQVPPVPVIPPHVRAKQKLDEALAWLARPREFCILVSDAIRLYLEERFDFHAPERTTEEFLHELRGTRLLTTAQKESLGNSCSVATWSSSPATSLGSLNCATCTPPPSGWSRRPNPSQSKLATAPTPVPAAGTPLSSQPSAARPERRL